MPVYPKRLIEVDLPIRRISDHARREKSIRHGHISTLHIWWARRPLAACRAILCASLWPDTAPGTGDAPCPQTFFAAARAAMLTWTKHERQVMLGAESRPRFERARQNPQHFDDPLELRHALLDFIADFANWDNSTVPAYLDTARYLTAAAHRTLTEPEFQLTTSEIQLHLEDTKAAIQDWPKPLVLDPFAGGGSIPLEALRVGAHAFASDLNPVPVLLNKVVLEYIPKYGQRLADEVRKWGDWIKDQAVKELAEFYPTDPEGATPIAYLWARTIYCEGPGCGAEIPLLRSLWIAKKGKRSVALRIHASKETKAIEFELIENVDPKNVGKGTCKGGAATCPICGYTTAVESVRAQMIKKFGGASDARLLVVVYNKQAVLGQFYRLPTESDVRAAINAQRELSERQRLATGGLSLIPDGHINHLRGFFNIVLYGITEWGKLFTPRQALTISTFSRLVRDADLDSSDAKFAEATRTILALVVDRVAVRCTSNCIWDATTGCIMQVFNQGQALPARWEFAEMTPCGDAGSGWATCIEYTLKVIEHVQSVTECGQAERCSATALKLLDDSVQAFVTDPPYYAAIPYADLSDFFFSWLKRTLRGHHESLLRPELTEKEHELVSLSHRAAMYREKNGPWFESKMQEACAEGRRVCTPDGIGVVVFANKETQAWETMLAALINAGWIVTASWPIDTESGNRLRAKDSAALASSVHLVCRPREDGNGSVRDNEVGDWRDVLQELPRRIHEWMPRLDAEGVVGADAIFACLGPALEVFSRYSRVERASGEQVTLKEYLEHVWAAVSREALTMVFKDADVSGFEEDARLTAIWLWTLSTAAQGKDIASEVNNRLNETEVEDTADAAEDDEHEDSGSKKKAKLKGFYLDYDAARKIAQGLGAHLEDMKDVVEVKGDTARLLPVAERTARLFGKADPTAAAGPKKKKADAQLKLDLFAELTNAPVGEAETVWEEKTITKVGDTTLDRIHQSMILFAAGRSEALKRFLVDDGAGRDPKFWRLAQALSALYPQKTDERRWVEGVMARKKGLGV